MIPAWPSLKKKIVVPLLLVLIATLTAMALENVLSFKTHLRTRLEQRADHMADLVQFIAGSAQRPAELQHLIGALGGEDEVNLIVVVAGEPARVVASTRMAMLGKTPAGLSDPELREELGTAMALPPGTFRFDRQGEEFDYFHPLLVATLGPRGQQLQRGAVMVTLDTRPLRREVLALTGKAILGYFVAVLLLAISCWLLLDRHVLRPVKQIGNAVTRFQAGDATRISGAAISSREFAELTGAWNGLVDRLEREEEERKESDEKLRKSEVRYRSLFENMVEGYAHCRLLLAPDRLPDFIYLEVNSAFEMLTGLKNVVGKKISEVIPGFQEAHPELFEIYTRVTLTGQPERFETHLEALGIWLSITVYSREKEHFIAVFDNITARKQTENALRESQRFAESIAENSTSIIYLFDLETGRNAYTNRNAAESLGYSPAQILKMGDDLLQTIIHPEDLARVARHFAQFSDVPDNRIVDLEYRLRHVNGDTRWIWSRDTVFNRRPNGAAWQVMGTAQDITERKQAEAVLEMAHRELVDASHQSGMAEVATSVLHNVGNVLNSVNTSLGVATGKVARLRAAGLSRIAALLNEHVDHLPAFFADHPQGARLPKFLTQLAGHFADEQQAVLAELESLRGNLEHINEIVAMQQSYAGAGGVTETLQLAEVIEDALRMNAGSFERHGTRVVRELDPALPPIAIDRHKLLLILVNLIRNAKHACDDGGHADKRITVRTHLNGGSLAQVSVSDNGIGIPAENLTRIFEHGFTTRRGGHGFGLHSSALAASDMGGALRAQSDGPGHGATFTIELPLLPKYHEHLPQSPHSRHR